MRSLLHWIWRAPVAVRVALLLVVVGGAAGAAYGFSYLFLRAPAPAAVSLSDAALPSASVAATGGTLDGYDGTWVVNTELGSIDDFSGTFVGYRVQEELATIGANVAVGRTAGVTGSLTVDGLAITSAEITADLTTLVSDDDRRDNQLRRQSLETDTFPTATFALTEPITIDELPPEGTIVEVVAVGELTLHGVTRSVEIPMDATFSGGVAAVSGSLEIAFADYEMERPSSFLVLSVDDVGTLEFQVLFTREGA